MRCFIKTERFTKETFKLSNKERKVFLSKHKEWIAKLHSKGIKASSGYLVNKNNQPGGGGLLIIYSYSYDEAMKIVKQDPMIENNLVTWELNEWIPVKKINPSDFIEDKFS